MDSMTTKQIRREYQRLLGMVFTILMNGGMKRRTVSTISARALATACAKTQSRDGDKGSELVTFGLVLDAWHRDRRYLTAAGKPKAVPLTGKPPSLEALIRTQNRQADTAILIARIKALRLLAETSRGLYKPVADTVLLSFSGPILLQHLALSLAMLLETVEENIRGGAASPRLLERLAEVPDLPAGYVEAFLRFSRLQGSMFVRILNDWLETRRARAGAVSHKNTVRAGVHVYAYVRQSKPKASGRG